MSQEKTEKPTPRRLRQAREQGDVPVSAVLAQSVGFVAAIVVLPAAAFAAAAHAVGLVRAAIQGYVLTPGEVARSVLELTVPIVFAAAFGAAAISFAQSGGAVAFARVTPKFERLDVFQGLRSLFEWNRLFGVLRALLGMTLAVLLAWSILRSVLASLAHTAGEIGPALELAGQGARRLAWYAAGLGLSLGLLDWVFVRRAWERRWMMSREEIKREYREGEGDPELKAARRRAHQEALLANTVGRVKDASVVIVNPTHLATALRYDEGEDAAPLVIASGRGELARRIVEAARQFGVPVVQDVPIARALAELEVGDQIPEALYEAVAEILREIWESEAP
jgi:FlhB-like protein